MTGDIVWRKTRGASKPARFLYQCTLVCREWGGFSRAARVSSVWQVSGRADKSQAEKRVPWIVSWVFTGNDGQTQSPFIRTPGKSPGGVTVSNAKAVTGGQPRDMHAGRPDPVFTSLSLLNGCRIRAGGYWQISDSFSRRDFGDLLFPAGKCRCLRGCLAGYTPEQVIKLDEALQKARNVLFGVG